MASGLHWPEILPQPGVEGIAWPRVPSARARTVLAFLAQLETSQFWPEARLAAVQQAQLTLLMAHCHAKIPFYRDRLDRVGYRPDRPFDPEQWRALPILDRTDLRGQLRTLSTNDYPSTHGGVQLKASSGSTGRPVEVHTTEFFQRFWDAVSIRLLIWGRIDPGVKLAAIRGRMKEAVYPKGATQPTWGAPINLLFKTGPAAALSSVTDVADQVEWLGRNDPGCLLSMPQGLGALAKYCTRHNVALPNLRHIQTYGGVVRPEDRAACREAWGVEIVDNYSAEETGYMALQCPEHSHLHVQSESVYLEILDERGVPCPPGEPGRVVVTPLLNFATPLLRYDVGDYAVLGEACDCGRGLPVLTEVQGRSRDMLTLPSGARVSPSFVGGLFDELPVAQYQVLQLAPDHLEVRLVADVDFTPEHETTIADRVAERLQADFRLTFRYPERIERSAGGKYQDFQSSLPEPD